jgi:hypothetical protein
MNGSRRENSGGKVVEGLELSESSQRGKRYSSILGGNIILKLNYYEIHSPQSANEHIYLEYFRITPECGLCDTCCRFSITLYSAFCVLNPIVGPGSIKRNKSNLRIWISSRVPRPVSLINPASCDVAPWCSPCSFH